MAKRAVGTKIRIGALFIAELTSIGGLQLSADTIDVTSLDSDGGYREFIGGFKDGGEVSLQGFFNPGDQGQAAVYGAFESGATDVYSIIFPAALAASWDFNGVVTAFNTGADLEDAVSFEATLKVSGKPTLSLSPSGGLTGLALTGAGGTMAPAFAANKNSYAFDGVTATSVTVTATGAGQKIKLYIDGVYSQDLVSGTASATISLTLNVGKKITIIASEDGKTPVVYDVVVVKTA